jgi:hypothetical protein
MKLLKLLGEIVWTILMLFGIVFWSVILYYVYLYLIFSGLEP